MSEHTPLPLLPCPFCNERAAVAHEGPAQIPFAYAIGCSDAVCGSFGPWRSTLDAAVADWNTRPAVTELVEALREAKLQLVYLAEKYGGTGTGNATVATIDALIAKATA